MLLLMVVFVVLVILALALGVQVFSLGREPAAREDGRLFSKSALIGLAICAGVFGLLLLLGV